MPRDPQPPDDGRCRCGYQYMEPVENGGFLFRGRAIVFYPSQRRARLKCPACKTQVRFDPGFLGDERTP